MPKKKGETFRLSAGCSLPVLSSVSMQKCQMEINAPSGILLCFFCPFSCSVQLLACLPAAKEILMLPAGYGL